MSQLDLFPAQKPHPSGYSFFLAVFPDQQTARDIYGIAVELRNKHRLSGSVRPLNHLHISLYWLGTKFDNLDQVIQLADRACKAVAHAMPAFEVTFDRVLSFRRQPMQHALVLVGSKDGNAELKTFQRLLGAKLSTRGNANPNFTPHVTLLYDRQIDEEPISPVRWKINEVVLVQSHVGVTKYDRLGRWTLGA